MNIKRAKQEIKDTIGAYLRRDAYGEYRIPSIRQRPILLMGPPGIGKTQIMEQIAAECDLALVSYTITHHTRQSAIGLPFIREKEYGGKTHSVTEYTMSEIIASVYDRMEESGKTEGILFIDEINCVSETLAPTMLQFLQCKSFGNQQVPEGWIIVAAGNPPEYNKSVREFDVVTLDRVKVIDVEADFSVWKEYAYQAGIHGSIISYLDIHKENFYSMETTVDGKRFATARGWQDLSEMIFAYEELKLRMDQEVIIQYIQHPKIAKDFANYLELYYKYKTDYRVEEILRGTIRPGALEKLKFASFDERLSVTGLLLSALGEYFQKARRQDGLTASLYEELKRFKTRLEQPACRDLSPREILEQQILRRQRESQRKEAAGQKDRETALREREATALLEQYAAALDGENDHERAFEQVRIPFAQEPARRENALAEAKERLEYAFDFMEAAFGESQEMVIFITELSVNADAVWFLNEEECPRYYRYNKGLLFNERQEGLNARIDAVQELMIGKGDVG